MDSKQIKELLKKYDSGETTLAEEKQLCDFFLKEEVPAEFRAEKDRFAFFQLAQQVQTEKDYSTPITQQTQTNGRVLSMNRYYAVVSGLAASLLLFIGLQYYMNPQMQTPSPDAELAYMETKKALLLISEKLNKGTEDLDELSRLNEAQELIINK